MASPSTVAAAFPSDMQTKVKARDQNPKEELHLAAADVTTSVDPLTERSATPTSVASVLTNAKSSKQTTIPHSTKIPHAWTALLASKAQQFRRSASVRLRDNESHFCFNTTTHNHAGGSAKNKNKTHLSNNSRCVKKACHTHNILQHFRSADGEMCTGGVKHETTAAARISPRSKAVPSSTQQQNNIDLSPALSNENRKTQNKKTDLSTFEKIIKSPLENRVTSSSPSSSSSSSSTSATSSSTSSLTNLALVNTINTCSTSKEKSSFNGNSVLCNNEKGHQTDVHRKKMSINPNGTQITVTTAETNVRPTTLATITTTTKTTAATTALGTSKVLKKPASPKTPKTISNCISERQSPQQHCCTHPHCSKYQQQLYQQQQQQQSLPTVPETSKTTPQTPPVTPESPSNNYLEDDLDSLYSFATTTSGRSTMSCEHPYVACNGTTFSGRKMKYVVHCSNYAGQVGPDYLTPTQRAQRQIRRLKELLAVARHDLEQKDSEILRLTREVVELRLFKASLSSPEDRSASSDAVTVREAELKTSQDVSPIVDMVDDASKSSPRQQKQRNNNTLALCSSEMQSSFADSGHFEDMTISSINSSHDIAGAAQTAAGSYDDDDEEDEDNAAARKADDSYEAQRQKLIRMYEERIEELVRTQDAASSEIKRSHNDKVEALLQKLAECNTRYADIVPNYEHAKERIHELEKQLENLQHKLVEHEEKQNKMYLHMYQKGQEAERIARADQALELVHRAPNNKVSINELLHQLQNTQDELENIRAAECRKETGGNHALLTAKEAISLWVLGARKTIYRRLLDAQKNHTHVDPEVTLQFLKSAIYYFLTDKENSQGHLQAIESILEFTAAERQSITKARSAK